MGAAILIVPVIVRNSIVGKDLTFTTTTAGINIYIGNHWGSTGSYTEAPFVMSADAAYEAQGYLLEAEQRTGKSLTPASASRYWLGDLEPASVIPRPTLAESSPVGYIHTYPPGA